MNAIIIFLIGIAALVVGYVTYGKWLADQWGVDPSRPTPSHTMEDGLDYCPAKAPVLMGHHFSSIAGAGPINGPIQAAVFGWVPVLLWVLIGGIFFGAVHDFGALFASIRHKGQSIGEVVADTMGGKAKRMFLVFAYLTLLLVVAAFASIVANTFMATFRADGSVDYAASASNASTAIISLLFIVLAILFGFFVYRKNASLLLSTILGIVGIVVIIAIGLNWHPLYLSNSTWMIVLGAYILVASVTPVWILLQPRDYLSSFLLYFMMAVAAVGIVGASLMGQSHLDIPAFTGFKDTLYADNGFTQGTSLGYMFPALFVTIACGAISGFHSLVASGTTAKQINTEKDARPIAYGAMLIESALAVISLIAVGYVWSSFKTGQVITPTVVFATGITRLARYIFQEFFLEPGQVWQEATGWRKIVTNPVVATLITVVCGILLGMHGYANIWPLFGAANQLLAALGLLTVATWLGKIGKNNKMFLFPMAFMLVVTITSLVLTLKGKIVELSAQATGWAIAMSVLDVLLIILAVVLAIDGVRTLLAEHKEKSEAAA